MFERLEFRISVAGPPHPGAVDPLQHRLQCSDETARARDPAVTFAGDWKSIGYYDNASHHNPPIYGTLLSYSAKTRFQRCEK